MKMSHGVADLSTSSRFGSWIALIFTYEPRQDIWQDDFLTFIHNETIRTNHNLEYLYTIVLDECDQTKI